MSGLFISIDGVRHDGFCRLRNSADVALPGVKTVAVWFEGEAELWLCDSPESFDALKAYWADEWPGHPLVFSILAPSTW